MMWAMRASGQLPPIGMVAAAALLMALATVAAEARRDGISGWLLLAAGACAGFGLRAVL